MPARTEALERPVWREALLAIGVGTALGIVIALARAFGLTDALLQVPRALHESVGPVWIPMALVAARVLWLASGALASRYGRGTSDPRPVRPELGQLAPLFAALGLCGTVWGLTLAFDALGQGEFLGQLPALLGGLGAAMTSTLAGLGLQIGTLLLAAINPVWSSARLGAAGESTYVEFDGQRLGLDEPGVDALVDALRARQPEALRLVFDRALSERERQQVRERIWAELDASLQVREVAG